MVVVVVVVVVVSLFVCLFLFCFVLKPDLTDIDHSCTRKDYHVEK